MMPKNRRRGRRPGLEALEGRALMAAPVINPLANLTVPAGKSRIIPVSAVDAEGGAITYSVASSDGKAVEARVLDSPLNLKFSVAQYGDITIQLLPELAPNTVASIVDLVNQGFYDNTIFHRVIPNFVIQGGQGKTTAPTIPDEFHPDGIFTGDGQLAMANAGKDTNTSQFFVTLGSQRGLDFNHTILGQVVRGMDVVREINAAPGVTQTNNVPDPPVRISAATIENDTSTAVILLKASPTGAANITLTATDAQGESSTATFAATAAADPINDPPVLGPVANVETTRGVPVAIPLTSFDLEGDAVVYDVVQPSADGKATVAGNVVTVTPRAGFTGQIRLVVGVARASRGPRGTTSDPFDKQVVTVTVREPGLTPQGGAPFSAVEGQAVTATVATFRSTVALPPERFSATIAWGDNTSSTGTIAVRPDGSYAVTGTKTYSAFGTFTVTTTIRDTPGPSVVTAITTATVADAPLIAEFLPIAPAPGTLAFSGKVASFVDTDTTSNLASFRAQIDWGDGSSLPGLVAREPNGSYSVSGSKTYAALGSYAVTVTILADNEPAATVSGRLVATNRAPSLQEVPAKTVAEGATLAFRAFASDPDAGQTITFSLGAGAPAGATIDPATGDFSWTPAPGSPSATIAVVATDDGSPALSATRSFAATVVGAPPSVDAGADVAASQFAAFASAGRFNDLAGGPWTATVDYGDGSGVRALALAPDNSFVLSHTYGSPGTFSIRVRVTDASGQGGSDDVRAVVAGVPPVAPSGATLTRKKNAIGSIRLLFGGALDASTASNAALYRFVSPGRDRRFGTRDDVVSKVRVRSATYDPATNSVVIVPARKLVPSGPLQLRVDGLRDRFGRAIDGNRDGAEGGTLGASILKKRVSIAARA